MTPESSAVAGLDIEVHVVEPQPLEPGRGDASSSIAAVALLGLEPRLVTIQCARTSGLPATRVVGLPDATVRESAERLRAAIQQSGWSWPQDKLTLNLAPASMPKQGTGFDLPMALAVLAVADHLDPRRLRSVAAVGELGLDGKLLPVPGTLSVASHCRDVGIERILVASEAAAEAELADGIEVIGVDSLREAVAILEGRAEPRPARTRSVAAKPSGNDLADVVGQHLAKRALEIAAAGGHHLLFVGPPGCGKTLLASRLVGVLPDLTTAQALETAAVHSLAGVRSPDAPLSLRPPLRAPHHGTSLAGLIGGGQGIPRPGEVSLATGGVLFLDEALEAPRHVLDGLREPVEHGTVSLSRSRGRVQFPANIQLVLAMNPCPCGPSTSTSRRCICRPDRVRSYRSRLSGPLADRIDLRVGLEPVDPDVLGTRGNETSADVAERVRAARDRAVERQGPGVLNRDLHVERLIAVTEPDAVAHARRAVKSFGMSACGFTRALRVARTIADLAGVERSAIVHVDEALAFRQLEIT